MDNRKLGIFAILGGVGLIVVGAMVYRRKKALAGLGSSEPKLVESVTKNGMTVKHYRHGEMPIKMRIGLLQDLTWKTLKNPEMRELALAITGNRDKDVKVGKTTFYVQGARCPERDGKCEAKAIYNWMKENIRYTGDIGTIKMGRKGPTEGIDFFSTGNRTVELGGEDCDGHTVLGASLLALNGITPRFRVTKPRMLSDWRHIYLVAGVDTKDNPTRWVAVDTTLPGDDNFGVEARYAQNVDFMHVRKKKGETIHGHSSSQRVPLEHAGDFDA